MRKPRRLDDAFRFPGFRPEATVRGIFGDPKARILRLFRRKKTSCGTCGQRQRTFYDRKTRRVRDLSCGDPRVYLEIEIRRVLCRSCGAVKQEKLPWLADNNPFYTKRFAYYVGRLAGAGIPLVDTAMEGTADLLHSNLSGRPDLRAPRPGSRGAVPGGR